MGPSIQAWGISFGSQDIVDGLSFEYIIDWSLYNVHLLSITLIVDSRPFLAQ